MTETCNHISHRAIEGILIYLNAFLALDFTRMTFKDQPGYALIAIIIITIIVIFVMRRMCPGCFIAQGANDSAIAIPPDPNTLAESFHIVRNKRAS